MIRIPFGDVVACNGQRFLLVVTNGAIAQLRVQSSNGETVKASPMPQQLGNTRYFAVSLGKVGGVCHDPCRGPVGLSFYSDLGLVDIGGHTSSTLSIWG
jgi:hypothetical protein